MDSYDVAVIGAGPAGVMAAWTAAKQGSHTVLLERETSAGRKPCAEGVLSEALDDAQMPPKSEFAPNRITGAFLYAPDENRKRIKTRRRRPTRRKAGLASIFPEDECGRRMRRDWINTCTPVLPKKKLPGHSSVSV